MPVGFVSWVWARLLQFTSNVSQFLSELNELNELLAGSARLDRTRLVKNVQARLGSFISEFEPSRVESRLARLTREFRV